MVIASGRTISRAIFSFCSCAPWPLSRCVRRRNAATERVRSSSPEVALVTVSRPRLRCSPVRAGRGVGTTTFCPGGSASAGRLMTTRLASSSSPPGAGAGARASAPGRTALGAAGPTRGIDGDGAGSPPARRRRASSSDCRLKLASCARRSSSSRLRASAASRSSAVARLALAPSSGVRFLAAAILLLLGARVDQRPRARFTLLGRQRGQNDAGLGRRRSCGFRRRYRGGSRRRRAGAAGGGAAAGAAGAGRAAAAASAGVKIRRFTFSTTTALLRPCEKLCLTVPCSTGRFRCNVAFSSAHRCLIAITRFTHANS